MKYDYWDDNLMHKLNTQNIDNGVALSSIINYDCQILCKRAA